MDKKTLSDAQIDKMIDVFSEKYGMTRELLEVMYLRQPPVYAENVADFPNDYLVEFLCSFLWQDLLPMEKDIDWKRFDAVAWGKLTARFGDKLNGKSDVVPYWGAEEWAFIISMVHKEQLEEVCTDCDKWDEFTPANWGTVGGISPEVDERIKNASEKFSLEDWAEFFDNCPYPDEYTDICPVCDQLREKYPDLLS